MKFTTRMIIALICIALAIVAINPTGYFKEGVLIKSVKQNSTAFLTGISPGEIITEINGLPIKSTDDYSNIMSGISVEPVKFSVITDKGTFSYENKSLDFEVNVNASIIGVYGNALSAGIEENMTLLSINGNGIKNKEDFLNVREKVEPRIQMVIKTNKKAYPPMLLSEPLEVTVSNIPKTNLKMGLDLQGGARGLIKPEGHLNSSDMNDLILVSRERLNVYGIADVNIREAKDLSGNNYMLVEVAGATPQELEELIGKQGKFEARVGNKTIFIGGRKDIASICRGDATCARIEQCSPVEQGGYYCRFSFAVYLSEAAAQKQADATANLAISENASLTDKYLNESLDLYLDDIIVDSLRISSDLKGKAVTQVSISGPGYGKTQAEAYDTSQKAMLKLQTILITGSLPFKLQVVKLDSVSPLLGRELVQNIFLASAVAFLVVALIIFIRYRKIILTLPILATMASELLLTLGVAAMIRWNLDLASIAGIIAAIGTGVDDQVVIIDESRISSGYSWKERIKRAFFIILGAFSTVVASLLPLWWAGAGLLRGFALTTLIGICIGVFITRPAFSDVISQLSH